MSLWGGDVVVQIQPSPIELQKRRNSHSQLNKIIMNSFPFAAIPFLRLVIIYTPEQAVAIQHLVDSRK